MLKCQVQFLLVVIMWKAAVSQMNRVFSVKQVHQGREYQIQGFVLNVRMSDGLLKARVKDQSNQIFNVHCDLKRWPKSPALCGCSSKTDCEHAAAAFLAIEANYSQPGSVSGAVKPSAYLDNRILDADEMEWFSGIEGPGHQFFSYELGILVDGKRVSIVPLVSELLTRWDAKTLESISENTELKLPIKEGATLKVKLGRIKPLLQFLLQYGTKLNDADSTIPIQKHQLLLMIEAEQALSATSKRWVATESLRIRLQQLSQVTSIVDVEPPKGLQAELRDYQRSGLNWLQCLREYGFGGVLADDMGLGKTLQTLAHLQYEKEQGRLNHASLIVAPTSLVGNWYDEAQRFTPELNVTVFHGAKRHLDTFDDYDVVITTYGLLQRDKAKFLKYNFYYLILDEAQFIKNARTKTTLVAQQFHATHRLCLSGTPFENHLDELWSLFHFLMPGYLGSTKQFRKFFRAPIEKQGDEERQALLAAKVKPFLLRRTKSEVVKELPPKTEVLQHVELAGSQRDLYEAIRIMMERKVRDAISEQGLGKSHMIVLDALLKLRQVCCDPRLLGLEEAKMAHGHSAKLNTFMDLLDNLMSEGRKVLVFSQFTSMLKLIEQAIAEKNYSYLKLTGQTVNRTSLVKDFQSGKAPIFLISLKAGGTGLNLTEADTVIHYDPWWNPAVEDQATDRSHRIGQENPVFVYKLICRGTVEEVILKMQENKRMLVSGLLSDRAYGNMALTQEELDNLFAPLD